MGKRIGTNPLDAVVPPSKEKKTTTRKKDEEEVHKARFTAQVSTKTADRVRDAVFWTPGLTLSHLTDEALKLAVDKMEKKRGEAFPPRTSSLKAGRPLV